MLCFRMCSPENVRSAECATPIKGNVGQLNVEECTPHTLKLNPLHVDSEAFQTTLKKTGQGLMRVMREAQIL